jgi:glycosyltransferase involved in cell wall biosynthesis
MRIGIDIKAFKNGTTGIARYLRSILDLLQELDRENDYLLFSCAPSDYAVSNPRWRKIVTPWRLPGIAWQQMVLPRLLQRHAVDLLWAPEQMCPILLPKSIAVISTVHDFACLHYPRTCVWSNRLIQKYLFPLAIRRSAVLLPVSDFIAHELEQTYPELLHGKTIRPVYDGGPGWIPPQGYTGGGRGNFLFFAGNLEPRKNLERLIRALQILRAGHGLKIPLHLAGPAGWKNRTLHALIDSSGMREDILFLGYLSEEELKHEYLTCKALVYPSLYEGFGLPVLEALSLDCLVLTSHGTVMREVAGDNAIYFDPESPESIAAAIKDVYEPDFERRNYLKERGAALQKFTWERAARTLLHSMNEVGGRVQAERVSPDSDERPGTDRGR